MTTNLDLLPLNVLLFRYFTYNWLMKPVSGDMWEQAAAFRHNVLVRRWLPSYMLKYIFICLICLAGIQFFDQYLSWIYVAGFFGLSFAVMVVNLVTTFVIWAFLSVWKDY